MSEATSARGGAGDEVDDELLGALEALLAGDTAPILERSISRLLDDPTRPEAWLNASGALVASARWEAAEQVAGAAILRDPSMVGAWHHFFQARAQLGRDPDAVPLTTALRLHADDDELASAVEERALAANPQDTELLAAVAAALNDAARPRASLRVSQHAAAQSPEVLRRSLELAFAAEADALTGEAVAAVLARTPADPLAHRAALEIAIKLGDYSAARTIGASLVDEGLSPYQEALLAYALVHVADARECEAMLDLVEARARQAGRDLAAAVGLAPGPLSLRARCAVALADHALVTARAEVAVLAAGTLAETLGPARAASALGAIAERLEKQARPTEALAVLHILGVTSPGAVPSDVLERVIAATAAGEGPP